MTSDDLRRLSDELEIRNLVARLAHMADTGDLRSDYLPLFTEDAVWEFPGGPDPGAEPAKVSGSLEILADRLKRRQSGFQGPGSHTAHVNMTLAVRADGSDTAEAESHWLFVKATDTAEPRIAGMGRYHDTFRRTNDGWKLSHRRILPG